MPSPGFIYFATAVPGYIKVGQFASHLTVADKERQYRTNAPDFTIHHVYPCDDTDKEEARVLARLRLVAGTDTIRGAGRENFKMPLERAIAEAAAVTPKDLAETARQAIYAFETGGGTVRDLLAELNRNLAPGGDHRIAARNLDITRTLMAHGIYPVIADTEDDLAAIVYGSVVDPKKLLKSLPALRAVATALDDLTF